MVQYGLCAESAMKHQPTWGPSLNWDEVNLKQTFPSHRCIIIPSLVFTKYLEGISVGRESKNLQKDRTLNNNNRYLTSLMVHMKSVLVAIVSAKTKYYEKLIISQQIISVRSNVITVVSPVQLLLC